MGFNSNTKGVDCKKIRGDVRDYKGVKKAIYEMDAVFHFVAMSRVVWGQQVVSNKGLKAPRVSIIVPVYNEEKGIGRTLRQIGQLRLLLPSVEVIVVDDGSTDQTASEIRKFPFVKCIVHGENQGKGAALCTGFQVATGDIFVIQDADLEYPPANIPKLLEPILDGRADVVYGSRFKGRHEGMSFLHYVGNKILSLTARVLYQAPITDVMTGHKCFKRQVIESVNLTEDGFKIETEITTKIIKNGWRITEVPITYFKRTSGSSKIRYRDGLTCLTGLFAEKFR